MNLESHVKMEMLKLGHNRMSTIYETIEKVENMIIEEIYKRKQDNDSKRGFIKSKERPIHNSNQYKRDKPRKFCDYHKSKSHSNEECRKQNIKNENTRNTPKGFAICEPKIKPKTVELKIKIANNSLNALMDTGATYNFISKNLSDKCDQPESKLPVPIYVDSPSENV
ncbi:hypothetical protein DMUE_4451 [Dictyocoela muelleri]|nr:hypothetical protein DMUE_4451 [Dictyocoela muelleri]